MAEGDNTSPTDRAREPSLPKQDWKKMIKGGVFGKQATNLDLFFFYYYLIRIKRGAIVSVAQNKNKKKGSYRPLKACVVTDMAGL